MYQHAGGGNAINVLAVDFKVVNLADGWMRDDVGNGGGAGRKLKCFANSQAAELNVVLAINGPEVFWNRGKVTLNDRRAGWLR